MNILLGSKLEFYTPPLKNTGGVRKETENESKTLKSKTQSAHVEHGKKGSSPCSNEYVITEKETSSIVVNYTKRNIPIGE